MGCSFTAYRGRTAGLSEGLLACLSAGLTAGLSKGLLACFLEGLPLGLLAGLSDSLRLLGEGVRVGVLDVSLLLLDLFCAMISVVREYVKVNL